VNGEPTGAAQKGLAVYEHIPLFRVGLVATKITGSVTDLKCGKTGYGV
jgi:hypothetical protein